jgi:hypothetical protein
MQHRGTGRCNKSAINIRGIIAHQKEVHLVSMHTRSPWVTAEISPVARNQDAPTTSNFNDTTDHIRR